MNETIARLNAQINSQNELYNRNTSEIVVSVSTEARLRLSLEINYCRPMRDGTYL
ncbi:MAG: hypothetical protein IPJ20_13400 [Flammeovirgaceae bacterium]|nr:hypothetical protein [Flammeovirgaceae bacterium]